MIVSQASKPREVTAAEQAAGSVADELVISTITEYNLAVAMISRAVRQLLPAYDGYECKEPEAAKFTLAFRQVFGLSSEDWDGRKGETQSCGSRALGFRQLQSAGRCC